MSRAISTSAALVQGILLSAAMSCAGPPPNPPNVPKPVSMRPASKPACPTRDVPGVPSICVPADGSGHFVVSLPPRHIFQRGAWVVADIKKPGVSSAFPVAVLVVTEAFDDFARVRPVCQREPTSLDGASARTADKNKKSALRVGKCVGLIARLTPERVQLDIGRSDDVGRNDVFEVRPADDLLAPPIGRVKVSALEDGTAWATPLDMGATMREGLAVVFSRGAEEEAGVVVSPTKILIANVEPPDTQDPPSIERERALSDKLNQGLASAAKETADLEVLYDPEKRVEAAGTHDEAHKSARELGQAVKADFVVWGRMASCSSSACIKPRLTAINAEKRTERSFVDRDRWARCDTAGFSFKEAPPTAPPALAAAILGAVTYEMQRFGDASYYLEQALREGVLRGDDELEGRFKLSHALGARGQTAAAREQVKKLIERAGEAHQGRWAHCGSNELALLDLLEGDVETARARLSATRRSAEAMGDAGELAFALHTLASLEMREGRVELARSLVGESMKLAKRDSDWGAQATTLYQLANIQAAAGDLFGKNESANVLYYRASGLSESIGDIRWQAMSHHQMGNIHLTRGEISSALSDYNRSLELNPRRTNRDAWARAMTLLQLGNLWAREKNATRARDHYKRALALLESINDTSGQAAALTLLANLEEEAGRPEVARSVYKQLLNLTRRVRDVQGQAVALNDLALLESNQNNNELARSLFEQSLELKKSIGDVPGQLVTHINRASIDLHDGKRAEARAQLEEALRRARALGHAEYQARSLNWLGVADHLEGRYAAARERWTEALALYRGLQMPAEAQELTHQIETLAAYERAVEAWAAHPSILAEGGVLILSVQPDGAAARAGLTQGDIVLSYDKRRLDTVLTVRRLTENASPSSTVPVEILRGAKELTIMIRGGPLGAAVVAVPRPMAKQ